MSDLLNNGAPEPEWKQRHDAAPGTITVHRTQGGQIVQACVIWGGGDVVSIKGDFLLHWQAMQRLGLLPWPVQKCGELHGIEYWQRVQPKQPQLILPRRG